MVSTIVQAWLTGRRRDGAKWSVGGEGGGWGEGGMAEQLTMPIIWYTHAMSSIGGKCKRESAAFDIIVHTMREGALSECLSERAMSPDEAEASKGEKSSTAYCSQPGDLKNT